MERSALVRNTIKLALAMAALSLMMQLNAAFGVATFIAAGGATEIGGLATALTFVPVAVGAVLAGYAMDRHGRVPVLAAGFGAGAVGALLAHHATDMRSLPALLVAFVMLGLAQGTGMLSRVAAADMYPPSRRALGMALVLTGAVAGALLAPAVFGGALEPGGAREPELAEAWLAAAATMIVGLVLVAAVRPDPGRRARASAPRETGAAATPEGPTLPALLARPTVRSALAAAAASYAVMVAMMALTGHVALSKGHPASVVLDAVGAHFVGMFAFGFFAGRLIDRHGPRRWLLIGLPMLALATLALVLSESALTMAASMFALGLAWNIAFLAASAALVEEAPADVRGRLLGLADLVSGLAAAALALLGGLVAYSGGSLALGGTLSLVALLPIPLVLRMPGPRAAGAER